MTHVFAPRSIRNIVYGSYPDWKAEFTGKGEEGNKRLLDILNAWGHGSRPALPEEVPKNLVLDKPIKSLPEAFWSTDGLLVVREPVRAIIDRLDPGLHQFFPIRIRTKRGVETEGPWFAMNVTAMQDSIVLERSHYKKSSYMPDRLNSFYASSTTKDIVVDPARQSGLHLWREKRFIKSLLGSDALVAELEALNMKFYPSFRAEDINHLDLC